MNAPEREIVDEQLFEVEPGAEGRLDVFAASASGLTRSAAQRLIAEGLVLVGGCPARANLRVKAGDEVLVRIPLPADANILPEDIPLDIVFEDGSIAVINKPQGMVVHPAPGNYSGTLVNALMYRLSGLSGVGGKLRPGIVHRLDKLTSGLVVVAKNDSAHASLAAQFKAHTARRTYVALVLGNIKQECGTVDAPIGRHRTDRKRMAVDSGGRPAVTHFVVLKRFGEYTLVLAQLETGRTHQIRVHMAHIKHPVAGDMVYGPAGKLGLSGQALHAARLSLEHPGTGQRVKFFAPLPGWFCAVLNRLEPGDYAALVKEGLARL